MYKFLVIAEQMALKEPNTNNPWRSQG